MSACSARLISPPGAEASRDMAQHPDVGGLPGPTAVNRQPYDLVRVCVCARARVGADGRGKG